MNSKKVVQIKLNNQVDCPTNMNQNIEVWQYDDLISEAKAIVQWCRSHPSTILITNNNHLKMTVISTAGMYVQNIERMLLDFMIDAAMILYTGDPIKHIDLLSKHHYCQYNLCKHRKAYEIQNIILGLKDSILSQNSAPKSASQFILMHQKFAYTIIDDAMSIYVDMMCDYLEKYLHAQEEMAPIKMYLSNIIDTPERYIQKLSEYYNLSMSSNMNMFHEMKLPQKYNNFNAEPTTLVALDNTLDNTMGEEEDTKVMQPKIQILSISDYYAKCIQNDVSLQSSYLWFGGITKLKRSEYNDLLMHLNESATNTQYHLSSFTYFENQITSKPNYENIHKKEVISKKNIACKYVSAKPPATFRKKEFAINHITKLVNNPYHFYIECILELKHISYHPHHAVGVLIHLLIEHCIKHYNVIHCVQDAYDAMQGELSQYKHTKAQKALIESKLDGIADIVWRVIENASEIYPEKEGIQKIQYLGYEYTLYGRADLIYKDKAGKYGIFDFKTGYVPSWIELTNGTAPQIALGLLMLNCGGFTDNEDIPLENICNSGFISPKKMMILDNIHALIESSKYGIAGLIEHFWMQCSQYVYVPNGNILHKCISRLYENEVQN
jgi:RecB family exonuclease